MAKILKNQTAGAIAISDVGVSIPASSDYTIPASDFDLWAASDDVILQVGNANLLVNNGSEDLAASDGIRLLQGGNSNKIQLDDDLINSDRIKVDVIGSLGDSLIGVTANDTSPGFLDGKIDVGSTKITKTVANPGGNESLVLDVDPSQINTSALNNDAAFIDSAGAPVQPTDIANFETTTELNARDTANRARANHTGTQLSSTISDFASRVQTEETTTSISFNSPTNTLSYVDEDGGTTNIDLSQFIDDTNLARIVSGTLDSGTGIATFTRDDLTTFTVDFSSLNDQAFINAAIDTHETSITNHDDINTSGAVAGDLLEYNGTTWLPSKANYKDFARSDTPAGTQGTAFLPYLTLNATVPETGNYKISWYYIWSLNIGSNDFLGRVIVDNSTVIHEHQQEPKDAAGTGIVVTNLAGGTFDSGTDQRHAVSGCDVINLTSGAHTIEIELAQTVANTEATIYRACLTIERWN